MQKVKINFFLNLILKNFVLNKNFRNRLKCLM